MLEDPSPRPYSLYMELGDRIKQGLNSGRKVSPVVSVDMTFDKVQFDGGLKRCGVLVRTLRGTIDNRGGGGIGNGLHLTANACHSHVSMK